MQLNEIELKPSDYAEAIGPDAWVMDLNTPIGKRVHTDRRVLDAVSDAIESNDEAALGKILMAYAKPYLAMRREDIAELLDFDLEGAA